MIFVNTKKFAATVARILNQRDCKSELIDGDTDYKRRDEIIKEFRAGTTRVLISTSMLARGLDVPDV
jgi:superfamily II DNA/RNA helicase